MYGSGKGADKQPYLLTKIYDENCNNITLNESFKDYKIYDQNDEKIEFQKSIKYYLPRILSIRQ